MTLAIDLIIEEMFPKAESECDRAHYIDMQIVTCLLHTISQVAVIALALSPR